MGVDQSLLCQSLAEAENLVFLIALTVWIFAKEDKDIILTMSWGSGSVWARAKTSGGPVRFVHLFVEYFYVSKNNADHS